MNLPMKYNINNNKFNVLLSITFQNYRIIIANTYCLQVAVQSEYLKKEDEYLFKVLGLEIPTSFIMRYA
jgi:cell division protein FtsI/penicillin-binding protein 2